MQNPSKLPPLRPGMTLCSVRRPGEAISKRISEEEYAQIRSVQVRRPKMVGPENAVFEPARVKVRMINVLCLDSQRGEVTVKQIPDPFHAQPQPKK